MNFSDHADPAGFEPMTPQSGTLSTELRKSTQLNIEYQFLLMEKKPKEFGARATGSRSHSARRECESFLVRHSQVQVVMHCLSCLAEASTSATTDIT